MKSEHAQSFDSIDLEIVNIQAKAKSQKASRQLQKTALICAVFMVLQFIGGLWANSIAIMSDAAHLFSDFSGFIISLFAIWMGQRPASGVMTFGYHRAEIIGALCSVILIWGLTIWLVYEAVLRIMYPGVINGLIMMITASIGLGFNIVLGTCLHSHPHGHSHGHDHDHEHEHKHGHKKKRKKSQVREMTAAGKLELQSDQEKGLAQPFLTDTEQRLEAINILKETEQKVYTPEKVQAAKRAKEHENKEANVNIRAAMIHIIGDIVQSIGVLMAATIIYFWPKLTICDPICTFIFSVIVIFTTVPIVKDCVIVLMEGTPHDIDTDKITDDINQV